MQEQENSILNGMPSLLMKDQQLQFSSEWPVYKNLPPLPEKIIFCKAQEFPNLLKLMPQKKSLINLKKCQLCIRRTYENTSLCRQCYIKKHGELKRRCMHTESKIYARGLCKNCYFLYYNHNLKIQN